MMAVRTVFNLFRDSWYLYRKYIFIQLSDEELEHFIQESDEIFRKYGQDPFAKDLILAVTNEVERKMRL